MTTSQQGSTEGVARVLALAEAKFMEHPASAVWGSCWTKAVAELGLSDNPECVEIPAPSEKVRDEQDRCRAERRSAEAVEAERAKSRRVASTAAKVVDHAVDDFNAAHPGNPSPESTPARRTITFTRASEVHTEAIDWLLDCWVPAGSVTLLGGREGIGKSTIAVDWAAQATNGELTGAPMNVAYVVTEDSPEHTVVPRLKAAGADLKRVMFLAASVPDPDAPGVSYEGALDLPGDYPILRRFIEEESIGLVVLDAAKSVMSSKLKGNDDLDIRRFLEPMHRVAQDTGCTFVCLVHFSAKKGSADTGNLIMGSSAWQQVARSVIAVAQDRKNETVKVWNSKANLAPRIRTMEAKLVSAEIITDDGKGTEVGRIDWLGECEEDGSALLMPDSEQADTDDRTDLEVWLQDFLMTTGPVSRPNVMKAARAVNFTVEKTIQRTFKRLGGIAEHRSTEKGKVAFWSLPEGRDTATGSTPVPKNSVPMSLPPTEQEKQMSLPPLKTGVGTRRTAVPNPRLTVVPDPAEPSDEIRSAVLDTLDDAGDTGLSEGALMRTVRELTGSGTAVPATLDAMTTAGTVHQNRDGRYVKVVTA